jgi:phenylacetate-CoA ligase
MSFFHLRTVPGYHWPALPDAVFSQLWNAYLELDRLQWLGPDEIQQRQVQQLRALLTHAAAHVPYYRELLAGAQLVSERLQTLDDFRRLPLLPRRVYQEKASSLVAAHLPPGTVAAATLRTAGSSGTPVVVHATNMTDLWWHALYLRDLEWCGIDPTGTLAVICSTETTGAELERKLQGVFQPCWSPALDPLIQTGPLHTMDVQQDPRLQWRWLQRIAPDYLLSYPANLEALAYQARQQGRLPSLRAIRSISATLTPDALAAIENSFGVPVKNTYSATEGGYLASPCPQAHGWHVHAENVLLEVLDEEGQPCQPGQPGRVYLTHLHNLRGPFVRYELGDEATPGAPRCPCGRGLPLLTHIQGKSSHMKS